MLNGYAKKIVLVKNINRGGADNKKGDVSAFGFIFNEIY